MPVLHISIFDYQSLVDELRPMVAQVDAGELSQLESRCLVALDRYEQRWQLDVGKSPLQIHGEDALLTSDDITGGGSLSPMDIGTRFLFLIGEFLSNTRSISSAWLLFEALRVLGWDDGRLPFSPNSLGTSNHRLLKPGLMENRVDSLDADTPYWHCLKFDRTKSGWFDTQSTALLLSMIDASRGANNLNISLMQDVNADDPVVADDVRARLRLGFESVRAQCELALDQGLGLFLSYVVWV